MTSRASGEFDVKVTPVPAAGGPGEPRFDRLFFDKQFRGDLDAASRGEMLASGDGSSGSSGAYVALERVSGTLRGKKGSFLLQHNGTMSRGESTLLVTVVPDSGTEELAGLAGKMTIRVAEGKHAYDFDYTLGSERGER